MAVNICNDNRRAFRARLLPSAAGCGGVERHGFTIGACDARGQLFAGITIMVNVLYYGHRTHWSRVSDPAGETRR
jgi:hypothetical protein